MSIELNKEKLESLSIADLSCLIEKFDKHIDILDGVPTENAYLLRSNLTECSIACNERLNHIIKDIFIY